MRPLRPVLAPVIAITLLAGSVAADDPLATAWAAVHDNTPDGWYVNQPSRNTSPLTRWKWSMYAYDPSHKAVYGEWMTVRQTELHCVQEMARCLGELKAGQRPK